MINYFNSSTYEKDFIAGMLVQKFVKKEINTAEQAERIAKKWTKVPHDFLKLQNIRITTWITEMHTKEGDIKLFKFIVFEDKASHTMYTYIEARIDEKWHKEFIGSHKPHTRHYNDLCKLASLTESNDDDKYRNYMVAEEIEFGLLCRDDLEHHIKDIKII